MSATHAVHCTQTAAPVLLPNGTHSDGTAIWHVPLLSLTVFHPAGMVCANSVERHKRTGNTTTNPLMAGSVSPAEDKNKATRSRGNPICLAGRTSMRAG